jgi:hypothetical protein
MMMMTSKTGCHDVSLLAASESSQESNFGVDMYQSGVSILSDIITWLHPYKYVPSFTRY